MNPLEVHLLLALAQGPLHGYAIKDAIASESGGTLAPRAGTLYRLLARLMGLGFVTETRPAGEPAPHPGLARRYYELSGAGRRVLAAEAQRLRHAAGMAEKRLGLAEGRS